MNSKLLLNFIRSFDKEIKAVYVPKIQPMFLAEDTIFIGDKFDNGADYFIEHMVEAHECPVELVNSLSVEMWSILHEVGHFFTWDWEEWDEEQPARMVIESVTKKKALMSVESIRRKSQFRHFNLPLEWMATAWAIDYAVAHLEELKKADKIIFG